ncbi:MAG: glycosyltransferase family 39 protein, partial [Pyrinomonadaceae bacterium]
MNGLLALLLLALGVSISVFVPVYGASAVIAGAGLTFVAGALIYRAGVEREFLLRIFVAGLIVRVVIGTVIFVLDLQDFFGGDAYTYDELGYSILRLWQGETQFQWHIDRFSTGGGWGMLYMVGAIYAVVGRNMLAIQYANAVMGAATAPIIYLCAQHIFHNVKVARVAAFLVAFYPSLILWSSQGLKDGPTVFLLALAMLATLKLGEKLSFQYLLILGCALFGTLSLRFYTFYMVVAAIGGAFVVGMREVTAQSLARQFAIIITMGLAMTYFGVLRTAGSQMERFGSLEAVQRSRADQSRSGRSGFGRDVDVSTTSGALTAIPVGMVYLMFAPFPWQLGSLRQSITLPEMVVWWASFPLFVLGVWFTVKFRLRQALPILIFTLMLTLAYSVFQGNIGTAYRQRSQLLVFYFIFVGTGFVLLKERNE